LPSRIKFSEGLVANDSTGYAYVNIDNAYVDNSWARVFVDSSNTCHTNFANCSNNILQIPTAWSSTQIEVDSVLDALEDETVYLYVVDSNGDISPPSDSFTLTADGVEPTCADTPSACTVLDCADNDWWWDTVNEECLAEEPGAPVNGVCGSDHGGTFSSLTNGNCSAGTVESFVEDLPTGWTWDCVGLYEGATANCSATYQEDTTPDPVAGPLRQGAFRIGGVPARFVETTP
jgi:hypothetical protein